VGGFFTARLGRKEGGTVKQTWAPEKKENGGQERKGTLGEGLVDLERKKKERRQKRSPISHGAAAR